MIQEIREIDGKRIGTIEEDSSGNKIARDFYGRILGKYNKKSNITYDFYGRKLSQGDITTSLIWSSTKR